MTAGLPEVKNAQNGRNVLLVANLMADTESENSISYSLLIVTIALYFVDIHM